MPATVLKVTICSIFGSMAVRRSSSARRATLGIAMHAHRQHRPGVGHGGDRHVDVRSGLPSPNGNPATSRAIPTIVKLSEWRRPSFLRGPGSPDRARGEASGQARRRPATTAAQSSRPRSPHRRSLLLSAAMKVVRERVDPERAEKFRRDKLRYAAGDFSSCAFRSPAA